jgi:hypothetical protein
LHDQLQKSVDQAHPASEENKLLLQQMNLCLEGIAHGNDIQEVVNVEKQFLSNCIRYLNQPGLGTDRQQVQQLKGMADLFGQMSDLALPKLSVTVSRPYKSRDDALKDTTTLIFQSIPRLSLLLREIDKGVERSNQTHLQHTLNEFQEATSHMLPLVELAQTRAKNMPLEVLKRISQEINAAALIDTYDERYGITPEMRQRAGAEN